MPELIMTELRRERDWSLKDLSRESGVSVFDLSDYQRGKKQLTTEQVFAVANALDTTIADLLNDNPPIAMDTCDYCGRMYHPMPVWARGVNCIYVCNDAVWESVEAEKTDCSSSAEADGYHYRHDLTPSR